MGASLSLIKKWGRERFLNYYGKRAGAAVIVVPEKIYKRYKRIREGSFTGIEWLDEAECSEDAFSTIYNAMQIICDHLGWERRVK